MTVGLSISVVIDTYNYGRFIRHAIEGVLAQTGPKPLEVLVCDDGSTDDTAAVVEQSGASVRYLRKANGGQASCLNLGIEQAHGDLISFLDADDVWLPGKLEAVAAAFARDPDVVMVQHFQKNIDAEGRDLRVADVRPVRKDFYTLDDIRSGQASFSGTSALTFSRRALKSLGPIPEALIYCPDEYLYTFVHFYGRSRNLSQILSARRLHGANPSTRPWQDPAKVSVFIQVREFLDQRLQEEFQRRQIPGLEPEERLRRDFEVQRLRCLELSLRGRRRESWHLVGQFAAHRPPSSLWLYRLLILSVIAACPAAYEWATRSRAARAYRPESAAGRPSKAP